MATATGKITATYKVAYEVDGQVCAPTVVLLTEDYTTFGDIPKILATARGVKAEQITVTALALV